MSEDWVRSSHERDPHHSSPTAGVARDRDEWVTGDEPMTGLQASYLATLAHDVGRTVPEAMTKADASRLIDELQAESDRAQATPPTEQ
jgi:hypothetical protein